MTVLGAAVVVEGLSAAAPGLSGGGRVGFLLGDGRLNYAHEQILEAYYRLQLPWKCRCACSSVPISSSSAIPASIRTVARCASMPCACTWSTDAACGASLRSRAGQNGQAALRRPVRSSTGYAADQLFSASGLSL